MRGGVATVRQSPLMSARVPGMESERPHLLNQQEAARFLRVDMRTLHRWAARGVGPRRTEFGAGFVRYRIADLDAWLDEHAVNGAKPP